MLIREKRPHCGSLFSFSEVSETKITIERHAAMRLLIRDFDINSSWASC
jgi:hypothetical protein